jgi:succinate dehydrogenase hydrophobic anchor subunit
MKNIYKITRGQLISIWIFGIIGFFASLDQSDYSSFATFLSILIPAVLIFYTIGWRHNNNIKFEDSINKHKISNIIPPRKKVIKALLTLAIVIALVTGIYYLIQTKQENLQKEQLKQKYDQAISSLDDLKAKFKTCIQPTIDKNYKDELRSCNLLKGKVKADYDNCLTYTPVSPRASCLYDYDYESIDCSQETLDRKAKITSIQNVPMQCTNFFEKLTDANNIIEEYSDLNKEK